MKGNKSKVQKLAQEEHGLPTEEMMSKIEYGWVGKPKGLLKVLQEEHGSINALICHNMQ